MHPFEKKILKNCQTHNLVESGERVVVGVSGGPDSMAMLYGLAALAARLGIVIYAAHADHGLRPAETPAEELLVREHSSLLGVEYHNAKLAVKDWAKSHRLSLEQAARQLRYDFFDTVWREVQAQKIAVAHNADDQAEEVLLRLLRGTGLKGLAGMEMIRENKIIRPLLNITRREIMRYLADRNIPYLLDSSNLDRRYRRNQVRLDLLPQLAADFNPRIKTTLCQTAEILRDENTVLERIADRAFQRTVTEKHDDGGRIFNIDLHKFSGLDAAIQRRLLEKVILLLERQPGFKQIDAIMRAVSKPLHVIHLAAGLRVWRDDNCLSLSCPCGKTSRRGDLIELEPIAFSVLIPKPGNYQIPEINCRIKIEILTVDLPLQVLDTPDADYLDYDKLSFPLQIRNRLNGDYFCPLGGAGRKKVGRFLSDIKMPMTARRKTPILLSNNRIAALPGVRISNEFRVTADTGRILKITMQQLDK